MGGWGDRVSVCLCEGKMYIFKCDVQLDSLTPPNGRRTGIYDLCVDSAESCRTCVEHEII